MQRLAIPAEEREEFAEAVDAENLSARELEQAIRERDEARKQLEAERQASEGAALQLADVRAALDAEKACTAQLRQKADDQAEKIKELENRPVEVAVEAADPAEIDKAVNEALADAEKKHKAEVADFEKRRKAAEKRHVHMRLPPVCLPSVLSTVNRPNRIPVRSFRRLPTLVWPHDTLLPLIRLCPITMRSVPQEHLHSQRFRPALSLSASDNTVHWPKTLPDRSIITLMLLHCGINHVCDLLHCCRL